MSFRVSNITFDCDDVPRVATFWSAVLGRALDPDASEFFASIGGGDASRIEPAWFFEKVPEQKQAKNRVHLDLASSGTLDIDGLVRLGATVVAEHEMVGGSHRWTVMQDPEGNEFCVAAMSFTVER